ncbi:hypothetical protein Q0Z83_051010 [Actinoplanes sichuanensis]|uniref:DUF3558 domain-containing protein n=1 Tax=Actinoplanes sichuanensis TaxID=512349 RepID=A0ABW4AP88_9ACTN|nr:hypothetical protein [Actinoplanes sichuanensis]BEL06910.1 hypothetical protein Q0Z83_051010 [Actinoplanes sichuanensis]
MKHRLVALTAVVAVAFTGGCGVLGNAAAGASDIASHSTPGSKTSTTESKTSTATPTSKATPKSATAEPTTPAEKKHSTGFPDPCTLLDETEVVDLTHREITQIDEDGGAPGDSTRYCQWQQSGGQLAVFLSRTTPEDFQVTIDEAEWVDGIGEDAYTHSGHLYVRSGTVQIDVYSRGASDARNLADAKAVATTLIPRI